MLTENNLIRAKPPLSITDRDNWMDKNYIPGLVTVIIPTYNRAHLLVDAIKSIITQTYRPIELIIVDDGSTDQTKSIVIDWKNKLAQESGLNILYCEQFHQGAPAARNLGLIKSQGEYIQFLDSDDLLLPQKTEWGVRLLDNSDTSLVYFKTQAVDGQLNPIANDFFGKPNSVWHNDIIDYLWHTSGPLYKRKVLREIGPWLENLTGSQDWEYGARIKLCGYQAQYQETIGSLFRKHQRDRISVKGFDYKYTLSAELAYDNIVELANKLKRMNCKLGSRFLRLYLTRALEYHSANYKPERNRCFQKALALPSDKNLVWVITFFCQIFPANFLLNFINQVLVIRRKRK